MPLDDYENLAPLTSFDIGGGSTRLLGNALLSQLWPLTGHRASGQAMVVATGADVILPPNQYAIAVTHGEGIESRVVKVDFNPATRKAHQQGGEWTVRNTGTLVTFKSMMGGARMNLPPGSLLRFTPPIQGINPHVEVQKPGFTGGTVGLVKDVVQYDDFPGPDQARSMLMGKTGAFPAFILAWINDTPVEGRTRGLAQGATRKGNKTRVYFENFILYIVVSQNDKAETRRSIALDLKDKVQDLLGDHHRNWDGEYLTFMGTGVEIGDTNRVPKIEQAVTLAMQMRTISTRQKSDMRSWTQWDWTQYRAFAKAEPPDLPQDQDVSAPLDPMPPNTL